MLPHEPHWYTAMESNEQLAYEELRWFDTYVKNAPPPERPPRRRREPRPGPSAGVQVPDGVRPGGARRSPPPSQSASRSRCDAVRMYPWTLPSAST